MAAGAETAVDPEIAGTLPEGQLPALKAILQAALTQSPTMVAKNIDLAQAEAGRYLADSALWPNLGGGASYGYSNVRASGDGAGPPSSNSGITYNIGLSQPIFQWGALKARSDIGKLNQQITQRQYADGFRTLAGILRAQYLGLIVKKVSLRNARYQLNLLKAGLEIQEENLKEGNIAEGAIIAPRLAVREAELNYDRSVQDYEYAKRVFFRLAGMTGLPEESIPEDLPKQTFPSGKADALLSAFERGGAEDTLQGQQYALAIKRDDLNYKIARTGLYPKFSFTAGYSLNNSQSVANNSASQSFSTTYNYSIGGSWTVFDGFATRGAKLSALANKRASEQQLKRYSEDTLDTAESARRQLEFLARDLDIREVRRLLTQDAVKRLTEEVNEGTIARSELEATTANFYGDDYSAVNARAAYLKQWADFVSLVGTDPALAGIPAGYLTSSHGK